MKTIIHLPTLCSMPTTWQACYLSLKSEDTGINGRVTGVCV